MWSVVYFRPVLVKISLAPEPLISFDSGAKSTFIFKHNLIAPPNLSFSSNHILKKYILIDTNSWNRRIRIKSCLPSSQSGIFRTSFVNKIHKTLVDLKFTIFLYAFTFKTAQVMNIDNSAKQQSERILFSANKAKTSLWWRTKSITHCFNKETCPYMPTNTDQNRAHYQIYRFTEFLTMYHRIFTCKFNWSE